MKKKRQTPSLLTRLLLVAALLIPQWAWAQTPSKPQSGDGTWRSPYIISSAAELAWFRDEVNASSSTTEVMLYAKISDSVDVIDLKDFCHAATEGSEAVSWTPIGNATHPFSGEFDGNGKTIRNLYIKTDNDYSGFFGLIRGEAYNLTFDNAIVESTGKKTGILAGSSVDKISGIKTLSSCSVMGGENTGGIVGYVSGTAVACENRASVNGNGKFYVGGVAGYTTRSKFFGCSNYGNVISSGGYYVGGVIGDFDPSYDDNGVYGCANYGNVTGQQCVGGILGRNYSKVTLKNLFASGNVTGNYFCALIVGRVKGSLLLDGIVAYDRSAKVTEKNVVATRAFESDNSYESSATGYDKIMLESGWATYFLQADAPDGVVWGQNLIAKDPYPVLGSTYRVYLTEDSKLFCTGEMEGSVTNTKPVTEGSAERVIHTAAEFMAAVPPTCVNDGTIAYWHCSSCGRNYSDTQMSKEITDFSDRATGHDYDAEGRCQKCEQTVPSLQIGKNTVRIDRAFAWRDEIKSYTLFKFTAPCDGRLVVASSSDKNTFGTLWKSPVEASYLLGDFPNYVNYFQLEYDVVKGTDYYIGVREQSGDAIETDVTLHVTLLPSGSGTVADPYVLRLVDQLLWFRNKVNAGNPKICAKIADEVETLDLKGVCHAASDGSDAVSWEPIGDFKSGFQGTFDGNGKTIRNLYVDGASNGLFALINNGKVKNITFDNAYVKGSNTVGILSSQISGTNVEIENIKIMPTCSLSGGDFVGGICGVFSGISKNCVNYAAVEGKSYVGGLYGYSLGETTAGANYGNVYATEDRVGGIVGYCYIGKITDSANYGDIQGAANVGGVIGYLDGGVIQSVFSYGNVNTTGELDSDIPAYSKRAGLVIGDMSSNASEADDISVGNLMYNSDAVLSIVDSRVKSRAFGEGSLPESMAAGYSLTEVRCGKVTYLLNGSTSTPAEGQALVWYQKLGDAADPYPVLTPTGENTVYKAQLVFCDGTVGEYANVPEGVTYSHLYQLDESTAYSDGVYGATACQRCKAAMSDLRFIKDFCGVNGDNLELTVTDDGTYRAQSLTLADKTAYDSPVDFEAAELTYTRKDPHTDWQVYYVPFDTDCATLAEAGITAACINNFHEYEKDGAKEVVLEVKEVTSGTVKANVPYVIRATASGEKTINATNVAMHKAEQNRIDCASATSSYYFKGIYTPKTDFNSDEYLNDGYMDYTLTGGTFRKLSKTATLSAMRWYLTVRNRPSQVSPEPSAAPQPRSISIKVVGEGEATGIEDIQVVTDREAASAQGVYDLQGRRLTAEPQYGVYIKNGKKIIK